MAWIEVSRAAEENRRELVLAGAEISERISQKGIDPKVFTLTSLNFLEISKTCLKSLPEDIGNLVGLTSLILHNNQLEELPPTIEKLAKLKTLDVSGNQLEKIPEELCSLAELESLNLAANELAEFPDVRQMKHLHILDVSHNKLQALPEGITDSSLFQLSHILANSNEISELPDDLNELPVLKVFNVEDNQLSELPYELCQCLKLKELSFSGNKLKDRRLLKMGGQCKTKSILDYLSKTVSKKQQKEKETLVRDKKKAKEVSKKERKKNRKAEQEVEDLSLDVMNVLHFQEEQGICVQITDPVMTVRPYIVCCVVREIDFSKTKNMFKRFINLQTKLHDTVCQKRVAGTIATHDLAAIHFPIVFDARPPIAVKIKPLFGKKEVGADKLVAKLVEEAEEQRKEKKRNQLSGIHKYLELVRGKPLYPCLIDKEGAVISFPPITNSDVTKISETTTEMLLEVTSTVSQDTCKTILHELLGEMLSMGLGKSPEGDTGEAAGGEGYFETQGQQQLVVEQVKVLDTEGHMKVVYPSRVDLVSPAFKVDRDYK